MRANQLRLWFASMAYVLICALDATASRVSTGENKRARKSGGSFKDMVR
jgi:hypothetical protein